MRVATVIQYGSSWPRSSSRQANSLRSAPSKSPTTVAIPAIASWDTSVQVGVADPCQQRFEALAGCHRRLVLAHHLQGSHRRRPQQLGLGVGFQRVGGGQQLVDPAAGLTQVVTQPPEHPQDPEQVRQRLGGRCPGTKRTAAARLAASASRPSAE